MIRYDEQILHPDASFQFSHKFMPNAQCQYPLLVYANANSNTYISISAIPGAPRSQI
jgi:hypothetical protein